MSSSKSELIDSYLREELNDKDLRSFENQLSGDPALMEEVNFQRQVVSGLSEFRKTELITRLNAIEIPTPWWQVGQFVNPAMIKTTGALLTAALIGTGIYYFSSSAKESTETPYSTVTTQDLVPSQTLLDDYKSNNINLSLPNRTVASNVVDKSEPATEKVLAASSSLIETSISEDAEVDEFVPEVALPNPGDGTEGSHFRTESVEIPLAGKSDIINAGQIDIKTTQRNSDVIRYKYYDGKLHLYGNFKETPYEILEINRSTSKIVYLFHDNRYFKLLTTDKVIDLLQITDRELIHELEIVRNNKVD